MTHNRCSRVVPPRLHLETEAAVLANGRRLGHVVQLDELDGVPQRPTAAVAHRHVPCHLNHRHLVDECLGVAAVDPVLVLDIFCIKKKLMGQ